MKKSEIYQILDNMELSDVSKLEVDNILGLLPDTQEVPADKVEAVMDIIKLETDLEDVNIQALDDVIASIDKAGADIDTLDKTINEEVTAKDEAMDKEEEKINNDLQYIEDSANMVINQKKPETQNPVQPAQPVQNMQPVAATPQQF